MVHTHYQGGKMDQSLMSIIEVALQQGIWAALYIYLFFRMLKQGEKREENYLTIIDRLNQSINEYLVRLQVSMNTLNEHLVQAIDAKHPGEDQAPN
jgi:hypothetical protein